MKYVETDLQAVIKWDGRWNIEHKKKIEGLVFGDEAMLEYAEYKKKNALFDEGEESMLDTYFRGAALTSFYFGLCMGTPVETDTLALLTGAKDEEDAGGYGRIAVARNSTDFPNLALDAGDFQVESVVKQFAATATWQGNTSLFLTDVATGTAGALIAVVALSATRTLVNGDTLDVSMDIKLQ